MNFKNNENEDDSFKKMNDKINKWNNEINKIYSDAKKIGKKKLKTAADFNIGRPKRIKLINREDILNLKIALNTAKNFDDLLKTL